VNSACGTPASHVRWRLSDAVRAVEAVFSAARSRQPIGDAARRRFNRRTGIACLHFACLLLVATTTAIGQTRPNDPVNITQPNWTIASAVGRWSAGDCRKKYSDYSINGNEVRFRDETGTIDIERITELRSEGFRTSTVSSQSGSVIGTLWNYTFSDRKVWIDNLTINRHFLQTRCEPNDQPAH
jgi:hypothetical protein